MAVGKITSIKREVGTENTMSNSLAKKGRQRAPGTGVMFLPHKLMDGTYATGLDPEAVSLIRQYRDDTVGLKAEQERIQKIREQLEKETRLDLSPTSKYWDYKLEGADKQLHIGPVKLIDGDNLFDFSNPFKKIEFFFLKAHPRIASSYEAFMRGDYGPDVQFYVHDEEVEDQRDYMRKKEINKAVIKLDSMSPDKRKKIGRLMGLPITESSREDFVYNQIDNLLKQTDFKEGRYKSRSTVTIFNQFADMAADQIEVKNLIEEAITHSIYRLRGDMIYEADLKIAETREDLANVLLENQDDRIGLEVKLKAKKTSKEFA